MQVSKHFGESVQKPIEYYHNNLETTLSILEVMREYHTKRFVFSSSATVYGTSDRSTLTEDMPTGDCTNPHGIQHFKRKFRKSVVMSNCLIEEFEKLHGISSCGSIIEHQIII